MLCITKRKNYYIKIGENITVYYCNKMRRYYVEAPKEVPIRNIPIEEKCNFSKFREPEKRKSKLGIFDE